jgi:hypothetical protein
MKKGAGMHCSTRGPAPRGASAWKRRGVRPAGSQPVERAQRAASRAQAVRRPVKGEGHRHVSLLRWRLVRCHQRRDHAGVSITAFWGICQQACACVPGQRLGQGDHDGVVWRLLQHSRANSGVRRLCAGSAPAVCVSCLLARTAPSVAAGGGPSACSTAGWSNGYRRHLLGSGCTAGGGNAGPEEGQAGSSARGWAEAALAAPGRGLIDGEG